MYKSYDSRLIKILSPLRKEIFSLDFNGDEQELKELLSTLIYIPVNSIKGLRDSFGNYYTLSSAIKNQSLTSAYGNIFTIVLSRQSIVQDFNRQRNSTILELNESNTDATAHFIYGVNDPNRSYDATNPSSKPLLQIKNISPIRKVAQIPSESSNGSIANSLDKYSQIMMKMINDKNINEKSFKIIQSKLKEDNEEVLSLFRKYAKEGSNKDLSTLSLKLLPLLETQRRKNHNNNDGSNSQDVNYKRIINSLEDSFTDKNDIALLHKLLKCDNKQILKALVSYECNNDKSKLIADIKEILEIYKQRLNSLSQDNMNNCDNDNPINGFTSIMDIKAAESHSPAKKNEKLCASIFNEIESKLRYDLSALFAYDYHNKSKFEKEQVLTEKFHINLNDLNSICYNEITKYYIKFTQEKVLCNYSTKEGEIYEQLIKDKEDRIVELYNKFKLDNDKDIDILVNKIQLVIKKVENERKNILKSSVSKEEKKEGEEEEEGKLSLQESSALSESDSNDDDNKTDSNQQKSLINNSKLHNVIKITYNNSNSISNNSEMNNQIRTTGSKKGSAASCKGIINQKQISKQLGDFIKVINKMVVSEESKKDILQLLSQKNEKMVKIFENFQNNRLSLTKKVLLTAIKHSSKTYSSTNKLKPKISLLNKQKSKKETFEECIQTFLDKQLISPEDLAYLLQNFQLRDEYLYSFWELYLEDPNKEKFFESIKMFLQKALSPSPKEANNKGINNQKSILINISHEFVNYKRIEGAELKRKQKRIVDLLFKGSFIDNSLLDYLYEGIDNDNQSINSGFDEFNFNQSHETFIERVTLLKQTNNSKGCKTSFEGKLGKLINGNPFNDLERKLLRIELGQDNQMLLSILEAYNYEKDVDDTIENLKIIASKLSRKK